MEKQLELYISQGMNQTAIAEALSISQPSVARMLQRYGLKTLQRIHATTKCDNCGKFTTNKRFCSGTCQGEYAMKESYERLKEGTLSRPGTIRNILLKFRENACEICGTHEWNNKPIPLVADHIDGNPENNIISNLRLICNNCDAQLPTYKGRNRGNGRHYRRERYKEGKSY